MLTEISNNLIKHFLSRSNVSEYFNSQTMKQLYDSLNNTYQNSQINMKQGFNEYPPSDFIAISLRKKISVHQNVLTFEWTTTNKKS